MSNIIKQLKENKQVFGLMSEEMQAKTLEIGFLGQFRRFNGHGFGGIIILPGYNYDPDAAYQLRRDYEEVPEIVEMERELIEAIVETLQTELDK